MSPEPVERSEFDGLGRRLNETEKSLASCQAHHNARTEELLRNQERQSDMLGRLEGRMESAFGTIFGELRDLSKGRTAADVKLTAIVAGVVFAVQFLMQFLKIQP